VLRLIRQGPFILGTALDMGGFVLAVIALRRLPLFAVQAAAASSLAVTAVAAIVVLRTRLSRTEWIAVAAVCIGLLLIGLSAGHEGPARVNEAFRFGLLIAAGALTVVGSAIDRWSSAGVAGAGALGLLAGFGFGIVAVAARALREVSVPGLLRDPAAWALALSGLVGYVFFTTALNRGEVTVATATMIVGETLGPALAGVLLLDDNTRAGWIPAAAVGFALAIIGALVLSRFGEVTDEETGPATPGQLTS
jgi:drug/metabolite transporter (DMT)-like permease